MKKVTLSLITIISLSTFAVAGGDISPVEPYVNVPEVTDDKPGNFHIGFGYSYMNMNVENPDEDLTAHSVLFKGGYNFNEYIGVEGRYTMSVGDLTLDDGQESDVDGDMSNLGIYAKVMYPVMEQFSVYGLLGYGQVTVDDGVEELSESGFQWGIGAEYGVTDNIGLFVDYANLYNDTGFDGAFAGRDVMVDAISVGATYKF
ncbi:porin family protein [Sulfurovum sp.]|uniref:porin family protein n=1 Tax=Sulfurovum sp. TaxID=1969726 RepID=UPI002A364B78|nr:porin family protein [Sulfurovum sp.]MDY0402366.1 porin family protein [Sulfurovum sp.]